MDGDNATIEWEGTGPLPDGQATVDVFECSIDGAPFTSCKRLLNVIVLPLKLCYFPPKFAFLFLSRCVTVAVVSVKYWSSFCIYQSCFFPVCA